MQPHNLTEVKTAFADYLSQPDWDWNWVVTQTFDERKVPLHSSIVKDSFQQFMLEIAKTANSNYGFVFGEQHRSGRPHWHAILHVQTSLFGEPLRKDMWKWSFTKYGRNRIEPCRDERSRRELAIADISMGIARYLTKYVVKDAARDEAWWDFQGFLSGRETPARRIFSHLGVHSAY